MTRAKSKPKARGVLAFGWARVDDKNDITEFSLFSGRLRATFNDMYGQRIKYRGRVVRVEIREVPAPARKRRSK